MIFFKDSQFSFDLFSADFRRSLLVIIHITDKLGVDHNVKGKALLN